MTEHSTSFSPDYTVHPGEYLEEVLESRGINKRDFAENVGISSEHLVEIVSGKSLVEGEIAFKFEKVLGISTNIWVGLSSAYESFTVLY